MSDFDYQQLDEIVHSRIRLAILAVLITVEEIEFTVLRDKVNASDGNLSVHLKKLEDAKYIKVKKEFIDRKPVTKLSLTEKGRNALEKYVEKLEKLVKL